MARRNNARNAAEKAAKKTHPVTLILAVLFFIAGAAGGVVAFYGRTENHNFVLNGANGVRHPRGANI